MEQKIYLYNSNSNLLGIYLAPSKEEFEADIKKYCSEYIEGTNYWTFDEMKYPVVKNGKLEEKSFEELLKEGIVVLQDGEFLENNKIKKIEKPNNFSVWNKKKNEWIEDKTLKKEYLNNKRYELQQKYVSLKSTKEKLEEEKAEFEKLGFDTSITENNIKETTEEMKKTSSEVKIVTKELKEL